MRALIAMFALMSFVVVSMFPDIGHAQTPNLKSPDTGKQASRHKTTRKPQVQVRAPVFAPAQSASPFEERPGPKMGM
jgi:hypothetical protein